MKEFLNISKIEKDSDKKDEQIPGFGLFKIILNFLLTILLISALAPTNLEQLAQISIEHILLEEKLSLFQQFLQSALCLMKEIVVCVENCLQEITGDPFN